MLLTNQNIVCEWAYDDEIGQELVENDHTIRSCFTQEGNAREKHVITENRMVYKISLLCEIRRIDSSENLICDATPIGTRFQTLKCAINLKQKGWTLDATEVLSMT